MYEKVESERAGVRKNERARVRGIKPVRQGVCEREGGMERKRERETVKLAAATVARTMRSRESERAKERVCEAECVSLYGCV